MTVHGWREASPDRLDALVWAITDLMLDRGAGLVARVRSSRSDLARPGHRRGAGADLFQFRSRMHGLAVFPRAEAAAPEAKASAARRWWRFRRRPGGLVGA